MLHTHEVTGSIPVSPTPQKAPSQRLAEEFFFGGSAHAVVTDHLLTSCLEGGIDGAGVEVVPIGNPGIPPVL